ncbi:glycosyltransferase [Paenibacillus sp. FSL R7-0216]|uniref:tetratricopeptide repeat-containing glycosyltransferase family 2 protein n=1 Tax=Paenibacillus sp. FSL R7-0216 TaxID=2921677 RepID=UPI0030DB28A3
MEPTVSLVMITKNEEAVLRRCLDSAARYVDEIVIVDTGSADKTKDIAREYGARVFDFEWIQDFSAARNFAMSKANSDWCLVLDADEYITNDCGEALREFIRSKPAIGKVKRIDKFRAVDGDNFEQIYISRLFPSSCRYAGRIHEQVESSLPRNKVDIEIMHDGYYGQTKSDRNIPILQSVIAENPLDPYYHYQIAKEYRGLEKHSLSYEHLQTAYGLMHRTEGYAPSIIVNYLYAMIASGELENGLDVIEREREFLWEYPDFFFTAGLYLLELISSDPDRFGELLPLIERYYQRALEIGDSDLEGSVLGTGSFAAYHNLGVFYEVTGDSSEAVQSYKKAASMNYQPSIARLEQLINES